MASSRLSWRVRQLLAGVGLLVDEEPPRGLKTLFVHGEEVAVPGALWQLLDARWVAPLREEATGLLWHRRSPLHGHRRSGPEGAPWVNLARSESGAWLFVRLDDDQPEDPELGEVSEDGEGFSIRGRLSEVLPGLETSWMLGYRPPVPEMTVVAEELVAEGEVEVRFSTPLPPCRHGGTYWLVFRDPGSPDEEWHLEELFCVDPLEDSADLVFPDEAGLTELRLLSGPTEGPAEVVGRLEVELGWPGEDVLGDDDLADDDLADDAPPGELGLCPVEPVEPSRHVLVELDDELLLACGDYWMCVVPAGSPDETWGEWRWVDAESDEVRLLSPDEPGEYEIRLHGHYPEEGACVLARTPLTVLPLPEEFWTSRPRRPRLSGQHLWVDCDRVSLEVPKEAVLPGASFRVQARQPLPPELGGYWVGIRERGYPVRPLLSWAHLEEGAQGVTLTAPDEPDDYDVELHAAWPERESRKVYSDWVTVSTAPGPAAYPRMSVESHTVEAREVLVAHFDAPVRSTPEDVAWLTVVPADAPEDDPGQEVIFVPDGATSVGIWGPWAPGDWELRLHGHFPRYHSRVEQRIRLVATPRVWRPQPS